MAISPWQLLIVLAIVLLLFGTKRLRTLGSDLGSAIKGFKKSMGDDDIEKKDEIQNLDNRSEQEKSAAMAKEKAEHK